MPFLSARTRICINMPDLCLTTRNTLSSHVSRSINLHWIFSPPRLEPSFIYCENFKNTVQSLISLVLRFPLIRLLDSSSRRKNAGRNDPRYCDRLTTFQLLQRFVQLMVGIVQHGRVVVRISVKIVMVHRCLKMIAVEASHGTRGGRVLMVLDRQAGRRSRHEILKTQIRVPAASSSAPG